MRLVQDRSAGAAAVSVPCISDEHVGHRMFTLSSGFPDIDGPAFQAYYCRACAERIAPDQVARAIREEDERASRRAY